MARSQPKPPPTHYQILQVHPAAPLELITAAYWRLVSQVHTAGRSDKAAEIAVYHLTCSYQVLANHQSRLEYDTSVGIEVRPGAPPLPAHPRTSWLSSLLSTPPPAEAGDTDVDYYELLRLDPLANPGIVAAAYHVMQNHYFRLVEKAGVSRELVDLLAESYEVISDARRRKEYDRSRKARRRALARAVKLAMQVERNGASANGRDDTTAGPADRAVNPSEGSPGAVKRSKATSRRRSASSGGQRATIRPDAPPGTHSDPEPASIKVARSLALGSATVLRLGGKQSYRLARKTSQLLRNVLVDDDEEVPVSVIDLTPMEEEALLERLSSFPDAALPSETKPKAYGSGALAHLSIVEGPGFGTTFDVDAVPCTLGEDDACDITLPGLALQQARLLHRDGQFVLFSLTDEPRTSIHGDSVAWAVLEDGDSFAVGPYLLKFESPSLTAAAH
jgi:curved DNA-binding protein CbpA